MYITPRITEYNVSKWHEDGFLVYYSYKQLDELGLISTTNPNQPWLRVSEYMLEVAREFKQMYITVYYAHAFGESTTNRANVIYERKRARELEEKAQGKPHIPLAPGV